MRIEEYVHLKDAVIRTDGLLSELRKLIVLPSYFTGGFHYMYKQTQDVITYERHFYGVFVCHI